eukprot:482245-Amphidinium_carterae.1
MGHFHAYGPSMCLDWFGYNFGADGVYICVSLRGEPLNFCEAFFAETKSVCQEKASEWADRSRLRTEDASIRDGQLRCITVSTFVIDEYLMTMSLQTLKSE